MISCRSVWLCLGLLVAFWSYREDRHVSTCQRASWGCVSVSVWISPLSRRCEAKKSSANLGCLSPEQCEEPACTLPLPPPSSWLLPGLHHPFAPEWGKGFCLLSCYFIEQKVGIVTPNLLFLICLQCKLLILCTIMKYNVEVITLPWKTGNSDGLWKLDIWMNIGKPGDYKEC